MSLDDLHQRTKIEETADRNDTCERGRDLDLDIGSQPETTPREHRREGVEELESSRLVL